MVSIDRSVWGTCGFGSHAVQRLSFVSAMREDVRSTMERAVWTEAVTLALSLQEIQCQFDKTWWSPSLRMFIDYFERKNKVQQEAVNSLLLS